MLRIVLLALLAARLAAAAPAVTLDGPVTFGPGTPRYISTVFELRDASEKTWPAFFHGRVAEAVKVAFGPDAVTGGGLLLKAEGCSLLRNGNDKRLIGELSAMQGLDDRVTTADGKSGFAKEVPMPVVHIASFSLAAAAATDAKKKNAGRSGTASGELEFCGKKVPLTGTVSAGISGNDGDSVVSLSFAFTFKGEALGLVKGKDAEMKLIVHTCGKPGDLAQPVPKAPKAPKG